MITYKSYLKLLEEAEINIMKATALKRGIKLQYAEGKVQDLLITVGDIVEVEFKDGVEKCIYEGLGGYSTWVTIWLRHFTKKGKPFKTRSGYRWDILEQIKSNRSRRTGQQ